MGFNDNWQMAKILTDNWQIRLNSNWELTFVVAFNDNWQLTDLTVLKNPHENLLSYNTRYKYHCLTLFVKRMYVLYETQQRDASVSYFVKDSPWDPCASGSYYQLRSRIYAEPALAYAMATNAGVVKAIVSF